MASNNVNYKNPEFPIFNHDFTIQRFLEPEKNRIIVPRAKIFTDSFSGGPIYPRHMKNLKSEKKFFLVKTGKVTQDYSLCCFLDFRLVD